MPVGACKDRLADALERYGRVPIRKRTVFVDPEDPLLLAKESAPFWASGGLVYDDARRVLLLRHRAGSRWGHAWVTPGGGLQEGEATVDGLRREVLEEVGLALQDPQLTRIFNETFTDGARVRHGYFAQFIARAKSAELRLGPDVEEARWFHLLPEDMAYRSDYLEDFDRLRGATF